MINLKATTNNKWMKKSKLKKTIMATIMSQQIKQNLFQDETLNDTTKMILNLSQFQIHLIKTTPLNPKAKNEITLKKDLENLEITLVRLKLSTNKTNLLMMKSLDKPVIRILL